jgi:hypothetical protein
LSLSSGILSSASPILSRRGPSGTIEHLRSRFV